MSTAPSPHSTHKRKYFNIHHFLREVKIIVVDVGGIIVLSIWIWHEVTHALAAK